LYLKDGYYMTNDGDVVKLEMGEQETKLYFLKNGQEITFKHYMDEFWFATGASLKVKQNSFELIENTKSADTVIVYNWLSFVNS
jgi:hypothetical protein